MTNRERVINCVLNKPIDRAPFFSYFGPWGETSERWKSEGATGDDCWLKGFGFDPGILQINRYMNQGFYPSYEFKVFSESGNKYIYQDANGILCESIKGVSGIPRIIKNPVSTLDDWTQIKKERLNPEDAGRFPPHWADLAKAFNEGDHAIQIGDFPYGLFGTLRDLFGVENLLYAFYDDPDLLYQIMSDLTDFWLNIFEKCARHVKIDIIHIWEDMSGKQGSLISPKMVREFMVPHYKRIKKFADDHGIPIIMLDTDGNCEELINPFHEGGINFMIPFEAAAGNDVVELRRKYPYMAMMGGIDKMEIAKGKEAIDREIERISPLLKSSGYIPALDHLIPPEISFADYTYYISRLKEAVMSSDI